MDVLPEFENDGTFNTYSFDPTEPRSHTPSVSCPSVFLRGGTEASRPLRIVHISDTHMKHGKMHVPDGDVLIHSGDYSKRLRSEEFEPSLAAFNDWLGTLPHPHKIFVAGNHEIGFNGHSAAEIQQRLTNATYLQDSGVTIQGVSFYGSPWTRSRSMGFSADADGMQRAWRKVPANVDVLITHMPPFNIGDLAFRADPNSAGKCRVCGRTHENYAHWGCEHLRAEIFGRIRPKVHLYGHVHDDSGVKLHASTMFVNGSYDLFKQAYVIDVHLGDDPSVEGPTEAPERTKDPKKRGCLPRTASGKP